MSCGYYLSREHRRVLVLDKAEFGSGSSGACDDMILLQSKKSGLVLEMAMESLGMYGTLADELGLDLGYKKLGGMILIENQRELSIMEDFVKNQQADGLNVDIIGKPEMRKRQPNIHEKFIASTYSPDDAQVDPLLVMRGFIQAGRSSGMDVHYNEGVTGVKRTASGSWEITSSTWTTYCTEQTVIASGAWSDKVGRLFGIDVPIHPKRGQLLITEKTPSVGETNLWTAQYMVTKLRPDLISSSETNPIRTALGLGFSFTKTVDGNYLIGSTREQAGLDKKVSFAAVSELARQVVDNIPLMRHVHIIRHIAGFRPAVSDGTMILGKWPGFDNLFIVAGHEGDGIAMAPVTGKLAADIICSKPYDRRVDAFSPIRFHNERNAYETR